jgi:hypothetical protein
MKVLFLIQAKNTLILKHLQEQILSVIFLSQVMLEPTLALLSSH